MVEPVDLYGLTLSEMAEFVSSLGEPKFRAKQLYQWLYGARVHDFELMSDLPQKFRLALAEHCVPLSLGLGHKQEALDGTLKFLLNLQGQEQVEAVLLRPRYGTSVCLSSQVGCRMGCTFCASGLSGRARNLTAGEMVRQYLEASILNEARVEHLVLMGSGEPMDNYNAVIKAMHILHDPAGINLSYRSMTISTSGLVPGIMQLAEEGIPVNLAISLHAANDELRTQIMPVNKAYPIAKLLEAARAYFDKTHRRVTYEYILIKHVNDEVKQAEDLATLLKKAPGHINLIPFNPVAELDWKRPEKERVRAFQETLQQHGFPVTVRRELGAIIDGACGQLRRRSQNEVIQIGAVRRGHPSR